MFGSAQDGCSGDLALSGCYLALDGIDGCPIVLRHPGSDDDASGDRDEADDDHGDASGDRDEADDDHDSAGGDHQSSDEARHGDAAGCADRATIELRAGEHGCAVVITAADPAAFLASLVRTGDAAPPTLVGVPLQPGQTFAWRAGRRSREHGDHDGDHDGDRGPNANGLRTRLTFCGGVLVAVDGAGALRLVCTAKDGAGNPGTGEATITAGSGDSD